MINIMIRVEWYTCVTARVQYLKNKQDRLIMVGFHNFICINFSL